MKKLLILGGVPQMIDIVVTAKRMGVYTIVVDNNCTSPAKRFADKAINISTDRIEEIEKLCRKEGVDGIFSGFEDFNIHIACELCERLGLRFYADKEQLKIVTNKIAFKEVCRKFKVPVVEQYTLEEAKSESSYPYIIKPADSYGSRGITVCRNLSELESGYGKAISVSRTGNAIIERFIDTEYGTELFYTVVNGNIHLTVTADRYTVKNGDTTVPLPVAEVFPSKQRDAMVTKLDGNIRRMLCNMALKNGVVLIQALFDGKEDFFVYEMAYRLTGEQHYRMVEKQHGINIAEMMIKYALGENISEYDSSLLDDVNFVKPSANLAIILSEGKIRKISGLEKVYKLEEVISYNLTHQNEDVIRASGDYSHMLIRINMVAQNYKKLCNAIEKINKCVSVISDDGKDMLTARFQLPEDV